MLKNSDKSFMLTFLKVLIVNLVYWFFPSLLCFGLVFLIGKKFAGISFSNKRAAILFGITWASVSAISFFCGIESLSDSIGKWGILLIPTFVSTAVFIAGAKRL